MFVNKHMKWNCVFFYALLIQTVRRIVYHILVYHIYMVCYYHAYVEYAIPNQIS